MGRLLKLACGLLAAVALSAGCAETLNVGTVALPTWDNIAAFTVAVTVPGNAQSGAAGSFGVNITGGTGPFEVVYTFDSGVTPRTTTHNITGRSDTLDVTFDTVTADATVSLTVTVTDANDSTGTRTRTFTLHVGSTNTAPTIGSATFDSATNTLSVTATDADSAGVGATIALPASLTQISASAVPGAPTVPPTPGSSISADFVLGATDPFAGGSGDVVVTATDTEGLTDTQTVAVTIDPIVLAADTLYAIPASTSVAAGTPVRIIVASGDPANAFQYLSGVRVTAESASGFAYNAGSFNVGTPGGAAGDADGAWTTMAPAGGFLLPPDNFITEVDAGGGLTGIDFNVTPIGGSDQAAFSGAVFSFEVTFTTAGTYTLGFQESDTLDRTWYNDGALAPNFHWGDVTNNHAGIANSITVN